VLETANGIPVARDWRPLTKMEKGSAAAGGAPPVTRDGCN
jgi:hypothetical protein